MPSSQETPELLSVLQHIHTYTWTLQCDDARRFAFEVAHCASRSLISTAVLPGYPVHGRVWKVTEEGLRVLREGAHVIADEELARFLAKPEGELDEQ